MSESLKNPIDQTKLATALLLACIVRAADESEPGFRGRFLKHLDLAFEEARDRMEPSGLELLAWTKKTAESSDYFPL